MSYSPASYGTAGAYDTGAYDTNSYGTSGYYDSGSYGTSGYYDSGSYDSGYYDSGSYGTSGYYDSGSYGTSGYYDSGSYGTSGYYDSGSYGTSGYYDSGSYDSGYYDTGSYNTGSYDSGYYDTGSYDSGYYDTGSYNTGSYDSGSYDSGYYDTGSYDSGSYDTSYNWWEDTVEEEIPDLSTLTKVSTDNYGDALYVSDTNYDYDTKTYILKDDDSSNSLILVSESYGGATWLNSNFGENDYRKVYAVEETSTGYMIAIKESYPDYFSGEANISWSVYKTNSTGVVDWGQTSYSDSIANFETQFGDDLDGDGSVGIDISSISLKTSDTKGDKLAITSDGSLYIAKEDGSYIQIVESWSGSSVSFDESSGDGVTWSYEREALQVALDDGGTATDTSDDKFLLAVKSSNTNYWDGQTDIHSYWDVYDVSLDGSFDWNGQYSTNITDYETIFESDLDEDGQIGIDLSALEDITTDTTGVTLKRGFGSLYISDGGSDTKITGEYGGTPYLEYESTWEGGFYKSEAFALAKNSDNSYTLALKFTDSATNQNAWEIHQLSASGVHSWQNSQFTQAISGYEKIFEQDLNGDGAIGFDTSSLTDVTTDSTGATLKLSAEGQVFIIDGSETIDIKDSYGGVPYLSSSYSHEGFSMTQTPYAVEKINDEYKLFVKFEDTYLIDGVSETNTNWDLYTISTDGILDYGKTQYLDSVTTWEPKFGQDLNGDGDATGQVVLTNRDTDSIGALLASDVDGALYIVDGSTQILIGDNYIEHSSSWSDGSYSSTAIAVSDLNNNGTADDTSDDYYQLAVKQSNSYTDYWSGQKNSTEDWQVYKIDTSGATDWSSTFWTQSIQGYEASFGQDLDGDGSTGLNVSNLTTASKDTNGWLLKKDSNNTLYISDSNGENVVTVTDNYGGSPTFDHSYNWGSGSSSSESLAAEKQNDGSFLLAVSHSSKDQWGSWSDYEILELSSTGVIDWGKSIWTQDIKSYENKFNDDLDGDGSKGRDFSALASVDTDTTGDLLKKDSNGAFFILTEAGDYLSISEDWGGTAELEYSHSWGNGSSSSVAVAVEDATFKDFEGTTVNGYAIAIKNSGTYQSESWEDWTIKYVDSNGVIDYYNQPWMQSIKDKETSIFNQDLDGDGAKGLDASKLETASDSSGNATDKSGDLLKKDDKGSLFIVDDNDTADTSDDTVIALTDEWGGAPSFDYQDTWGTFSYTSSAFAVESFSDSGTKKFLLAIKSTDTYSGSTNTNWETYKVSSSGVIDWGSGSWSQSIGKKESVFGHDMDGDGAVWDSSNITTTAVSTDTSTSANTAVTLTKDAQGALYITKGQTNIAIVDDNDSPVNFDWSHSWGGQTFSSTAFAVEGLDTNSDSTIDKYKLAIKHSQTDTITSLSSENWETIEISTAGVVDWSTVKWGDASPHEIDLNQDLDGDGSIWSVANLTLTAVDTDVLGVTPYLDENNNLYIMPGQGQQKKAVYDGTGNLISFEESQNFGSSSLKSELMAVESTTVGSDDYYKLLIKETFTSGSVSGIEYQTVNVDPTTMLIDWGTWTQTDDPTKLESIFNQDINQDGTVTNITTATTKTAVSTDITGASLKETSDGSLFATDGDTTFALVDKGGNALDFNVSETWDGGSYKTQSLAIQKVGTEYKLAVKETIAFGDETSEGFIIHTISSDGVLDKSKEKFRTTSELNESEFGQDLNGDGNTSQGSTSDSADSFADKVKTGNTDQEVVQKFSNVAQSDIYSISNADTSSSDTAIEMFVNGVTGSAKANYALDVKITKEPSTSLLGKIGNDTGSDGSNLKASTGVMDFTVTIPDQQNYGDIVSLSWVLSDIEDGVTPKYMKEDSKGTFFSFEYDTSTGEGAKWDADNKTMTVYVRDNGKYDDDPTAGKVRDPGLFITDSSSSSSSSTPTYSITTSMDPRREGNTLTTTVNTTNVSNGTNLYYSLSGTGISSSDISSSDNLLGSGSVNASGTFSFSHQIIDDSETEGAQTLDIKLFSDSSRTNQVGTTSQITFYDALSEGGDSTAPTISGPSGSSASVNEDVTSVYTFSADETVTWSLNSGGEDSGKFIINSSSGLLEFATAPDYESPLDSNSDNSYEVVISATDTSGNVSNQTVNITVNNLIDTGIAIATVNDSYTADSKGFSSVSGAAPVTITAYEVGKETTLDSIKDYGGNLHAGDNLAATASSYKYQGMLDVNGDGIYETIFTNKVSRRWVTGKVDSITGQIDFDDHGSGGGTRVVGIYDDPLIAIGESNGGYLEDGVTPAPANFGVSDSDRYVQYNGETVDRLALNSQVRFQNDLEIDNLVAKHSGNYDGDSDGVHEVYWKTADGTAYLRSLMHADGNIRYANYQSEDQMKEYLTSNGHESIISDIMT